MEEVKRILRITIAIWVIVAGYGYEFLGHRDLFEYITFLMMWGYVSFDIKTEFKHLITALLLWNVADESVVVFGVDWLDATGILLLSATIFLSLIHI